MRKTRGVLEILVIFGYDREREKDYNTLTLRSARDDESGEMLDIIFGARGVDVALVYNGTTKLQNTLQNAMQANSFTWASAAASESEKLQNQQFMFRLNCKGVTPVVLLNT